MSEHLVFRVERGGGITCLSGSGVEEVFDLRALGRATTERAGHIYFIESDQTWGWVSEDSLHGKRGFRTRREAVADEVATLSAKL